MPYSRPLIFPGGHDPPPCPDEELRMVDHLSEFELRRGGDRHRMQPWWASPAKRLAFHGISPARLGIS